VDLGWVILPPLKVAGGSEPDDGYQGNADTSSQKEPDNEFGSLRRHGLAVLSDAALVVLRFAVEELSDRGVITVIPEMLRVPFCDNASGPFIQHNHPVGDSEYALEFMGHNNHGRSKTPVEMNDQVIYPC